MFKFLRFDISGASVAVWMLIFLCPYLVIASLITVDATKIFAVLIGSVTLSIPMGNYIHQLTDTIFNPFGRRRLLLWPRAVIREIEKSTVDVRKFKDKSLQAILVFSKATQIVHKKEMGTHQERQWHLNAELLREEISNRYSYYYARLENGVVAPFFGFLLALLIRCLFANTIYISRNPTWSPAWSVGAALILGLLISWRIPQLFRELDDLEVALVKNQEEAWLRL